MAQSAAATGLTVQQWDAKFFKEYLHQNRFKRYMGTDENSIIQLKDDLTKKKGDSVTFALVNKLTGSGVTGSNTLEGNEEDMVSRSHKVTIDQIRNAVLVPALEEQFSAIPLRDATRATLKSWMMEKTKTDIITALGSKNGTAYASANATARNAWNVDNADRVLYGAAVGNYNATHATATATVDGTTDVLTPGAVSLMKRIAQSADPKIRPIRTKEDEEWFVLFAHRLCFRDLANNSDMKQANRDARIRGENNPLFTGGDLLWDGVVIKEVPEIPTLTNEGASGTTDIAENYFCGAQALGIAWAKRTFTKTQDTDYEDKMGVAIGEWRGIEKLTFGSGSTDTADLKDHGVVTGYFAAVADA